MRRDNLFLGSLLILLGGLFYLKAAGILPGEVLTWFWPLFLVALGIWVVAGVFVERRALEGEETFSIPLGDARQASLKLAHGAGQVEISAGAPSGQLLVGPLARGMSHSSRLVGDKLEASIEAGPTFVPFIGPRSGVWRFRLNGELPLTLHIEAGATQLNLDLSDLRLTYAQIKTGASSTRLTLPARAGSTLVDIEAGAASMDIRVPEGVAARIRSKEGVLALNVDTKRFPPLGQGVYQSADYDQAANRVEVSLEAGLGSVRVH